MYSQTKVGATTIYLQARDGVIWVEKDNGVFSKWATPSQDRTQLDFLPHVGHRDAREAARKLALKAGYLKVLTRDNVSILKARVEESLVKTRLKNDIHIQYEAAKAVDLVLKSEANWNGGAGDPPKQPKSSSRRNKKAAVVSVEAPTEG